MALTYHHVTAAGAGLKNGSSWANAMGEAEFETDLEGAVAGDDVYFVKAGTYTLDSAYDSSARSGTATAPISIIGVKAATTNEGASVVYSDWGQGADRPFFDCATYQFKVGAYYIIRNIQIQGEAQYTMYTGTNCTVENCKFDQDIASSTNYYSLLVYDYSRVINCEFVSAKASGVFLYNQGCRAMFNYFHDMPDGTGGNACWCDAALMTIAFNVFDNVRVGVFTGGYDYHAFLNNTFYDADTGVSGSDSYSCIAINNVMEANTADGFYWSTQSNINFFWDNHGDDARCTDMWDGVDTTTIFQDYAVTTGDPKFTTAGSNFSLQTDSPCIDSGMSIGLGV